MAKMTSATLTPAKDREYSSKEEMRESFLSGDKFTLEYPARFDTHMCSIHDFEKGASVILRFSNYTLGVVVQVGGAE